jgi:phosphoribosyl 1,2-cyclic phosphodiesterase
VRIRFLGTGAANGTAGSGRSRRRESSLYIETPARILIDAGRDFRPPGPLDAVLLSHGHRDAVAGLPALRRWWAACGSGALPIYAHPGTFAVLARRHVRLAPLEPIAVRPGRRLELAGVTLRALVVPHAGPAWPTLAFRLEAGGRVLVYASDVAALTPALERLSQGADLLVIDGAMWGRSLPSHLRIDAVLPRLCGWPVARIVFTQIGASAPAHETLARELHARCARARPAHDGLRLTV